MNKSNRVVHITTVHSQRDMRIFHKECKSLSEWGYDVKLLAPGSHSFTEDGVEVIATKLISNRLLRMMYSPIANLIAALRLRPRIVHVHDPELMLVAWLMKMMGLTVIYDSHEDLPRQLLGKHWLAKSLKPGISAIVDTLEVATVNCLDRVVAATPTIANRFSRHKTYTVRNYPLESEFTPRSDLGTDLTDNSIVYVGGLTESRGIRNLVNAISGIPERLQARLRLAGPFESEQFRKNLEQSAGWKRVSYAGMLGRTGVSQLLSTSRVGAVILHSLPNYMVSLPVKMFEYMAAGLPVVASNFPLWRKIIEDAKCGIVVDPFDQQSIIDAFTYLLDNPSEAAFMGQNGANAVARIYNWSSEAKVLKLCYDSLASC